RGRYVVERTGGETGAATRLLAAGVVVRQHARNAERSRLGILGHAVPGAVQRTDRDAGALGGREPADLRDRTLARNPRGVDRRRHVDRGADIQGRDPDDGEAAEFQRTGPLGKNGLGTATARRTDARKARRTDATDAPGRTVFGLQR